MNEALPRDITDPAVLREIVGSSSHIGALLDGFNAHLQSKTLDMCVEWLQWLHILALDECKKKEGIPHAERRSDATTNR